jgi:GNAT superfamily N-acetyltransferase
VNDFNYRDVIETDLDILLSLIQELASHEGRPEAVSISKERLSELLFDPNPVAHGIVGMKGSEIIGYALLAIKFSSFKGHKTAYIEDVLVSQSVRGEGLGLNMMRAVAAKAKSLDCTAIEWSALDDNDVALGFYDYLGATREQGRIHFEFDDQDIEKLLNGEKCD